ncbi:plasmid mobilization protein [Prevotella nigrescens]|jgi:DNA-binding FrmR family transcriptional regulator|uniref:plasmid mobilization protein n=1 Tax=Prevotella nigrescens TaxID=28133 RepID=UPI00361D4789
MNRYNKKTAKWQRQNKNEVRMNKTEFIKVRCTLEEKQRIKSKAESTGRKFSDYCREILLNGEVTAVPKMTDHEREAIAILQQTGKFYGQVSNLIKVKDERWVLITKNLSLCAKEAFKRFYDPHFRVNDEVYKVLNLTGNDRKI